MMVIRAKQFVRTIHTKNIHSLKREREKKKREEEGEKTWTLKC